MNPDALLDRWVQEEAGALEHQYGWCDPEVLEVRIEDRIEWELAAMGTAQRLMMRVWLEMRG